MKNTSPNSNHPSIPKTKQKNRKDKHQFSQGKKHPNKPRRRKTKVVREVHEKVKIYRIPTPDYQCFSQIN